MPREGCHQNRGFRTAKRKRTEASVFFDNEELMMHTVPWRFMFCSWQKMDCEKVAKQVVL
jgi:hypothetical protein